MTAPRTRRWFRFAFSLRTLFVAVTLLGTVGYWLARQAMVRTADAVFRSTSAALDADTVTARDACEASVQLLNAELSVPLADHAKAKAAHLQRIETIKRKTDAIAIIGLHGDDGPALPSAVDAYYAEAQRLASGQN